MGENWTNLVVPSKRGGGSEAEVRAGGKTSWKALSHTKHKVRIQTEIKQITNINSTLIASLIHNFQDIDINNKSVRTLKYQTTNKYNLAKNYLQLLL